MFDVFFTPQGLLSLLTLAGMEIVLGIDNIVFVTILVSKLPHAQRAKARQLGIGGALLTRLMLLFTISWVMGLKDPLFEVLGKAISGRDLILLSGGLFLVGKATYEIHDKLEITHEEAMGGGRSTFGMTILQIMILDIVFSLDSVITAVGMAQHLSIMVVAMVMAVGVMLLASGAISDFVERHPTMKILALSFLILIGVMLVAEGMGQHVNKGYIYFAMMFSLAVELVNMRVRAASGKPVMLHGLKVPEAMLQATHRPSPSHKADAEP